MSSAWAETGLAFHVTYAPQISLQPHFPNCGAVQENRRFRLCYREQEQRALLPVHSLIVVSSEQCVLSLVYSLSPVLLAINLPVLSRSFPHVIRQFRHSNSSRLPYSSIFILGSSYSAPRDSIFETSLLFISFCAAVLPLEAFSPLLSISSMLSALLT